MHAVTVTYIIYGLWNGFTHNETPLLLSQDCENSEINDVVIDALKYLHPLNEIRIIRIVPYIFSDENDTDISCEFDIELIDEEPTYKPIFIQDVWDKDIDKRLN